MTRWLYALLVYGLFTKSQRVCDAFPHIVLSSTWKSGQNFKYQGACVVDVVDGDLSWTINITFSKDISHIQLFNTVIISNHPTMRWICVKNKYNTQPPQTYEAKFQPTFSGVIEPVGECFVLKNSQTVCLDNDEPAVTTTDAVTYTTTELAPTTTFTDSSTTATVLSTTTIPVSTSTSEITGPNTTATDTSSTASTGQSTSTTTTASDTATAAGPSTTTTTVQSTSATTGQGSTATTGPSSTATTDTTSTATTGNSTTTTITGSNTATDPGTTITTGQSATKSTDPSTTTTSHRNTRRATGLNTATTTTSGPSTTIITDPRTTGTNDPTAATTSGQKSTSMTGPSTTQTTGRSTTNSGLGTTASISRSTTLSSVLCSETTVTPTVQTATRENCLCVCSDVKGISLQVFQDMLKSLQVDKSKLSKTRRKLSSAEDNREESKAMGFVGIAFITVVISLLILVDLSNTIQYIRLRFINA